MFYSQFILAKKGPLGTIWIAAHLERKLRKNQVADTDIGVSVDSILFPEVPIALRLSSHLLLGVVRIYSRKVNYLFDDCSEALLKIKQAFRSTAVDLPPEESTAPYNSITLPETFDLDDFELPDNDIFHSNFVDHHVSSKEQITLQDTMEGVVYSTSQFGLDERFGDGDTSGLLLDEEMFLDKVAAAGDVGVMLSSDADPQASVQPMTPLNQDVAHEGMIEFTTEDINGVDGDTDFVEFAQAPGTPGLVEGPNLSNVQAISACDDHLESENRNLIEFSGNENLENAFSKCDNHHGTENVLDCSSHGDVNPDTVTLMPAEENGYHLGDTEINQLKAQGQSSDLADQFRAISPVLESSDRIIAASGGPYREEDLRTDIVNSKTPDIHYIAVSHGGHVEPQGVTLGERNPDMSGLSGTCQHASEGFSLNNQASPKTEVSNNVRIGGQFEESCHVNDESELITESNDRPDLQNPETQACQEPNHSRILNISVHEEMACIDTHVLRPCNTHMNQHDTLNPGGGISLEPYSPFEAAVLCSLETSAREDAPYASGVTTVLQGEKCHVTDGLEQVLGENDVTEPVSCENIQNQADNVISGDNQLENSSAGPHLPAPERLLSVPESLADQHILLVEATPDKGGLAEVDGDGAGSNIISGKKRSFTESTLTVQSLDSVESLGVVQTKRTVESIPDDDDLLSSILGGRSVCLKVKPTPPRPETSMKRPRSASRLTASKRKVLIDDTMVLHGDTIRQQLTNTEDIRRVRKKAPCTHLEISMIQNQFMEDEMFTEPILTGVSAELASLHCQIYDLSETMVSQNAVHTASFEAAADRKFISQNDENGTNLEIENVNKRSGIDGSIESSVVRGSGEGHETAALTENQQREDHLMGLEFYDTQFQLQSIDVAEPKGSQHELVLDTEMDIDGRSISAAEAVNPGISIGVESSYHIDPVSGDTHDMPADLLQLASLDKTSEADASVKIDAPSISPDQKLDMLDMSSCKGVDGNEAADEKNNENAEVDIESRPRNEYLEETQADASVEVGIDIQNDCSGYMEGANSSTTFSVETNVCSTQAVPVDMEGIRGDNQIPIVEDEFLDAAAEYNADNLTSNGFFGGPIPDSSYVAEVNVDVRNMLGDDGLNPGLQDCYPLRMADIETSVIKPNERDEFDYSTVEHDTEFLNFDDDEVAEADNNGMPNAEETRYLENSGWSSRTRAVAKYLQTLFDKEAEHGRKVLPMDSLLTGKTRKEASRMFFEALVLKTRDYIHVEQQNPFDNINIKSRAKLMKLGF